jgi:hypothetical protein
MSSSGQFFTLVTLSDRVVPGFAGITRASIMSGASPSSREIKVVIGSPSHVSEGKAISFAKKATKHIRIGRRWSLVNACVELMPPSQLLQLGTPYQTRGGLTAWVVE